MSDATYYCPTVGGNSRKEKKRMHAPICFECEKLEVYQGPETPGFSHSF